MSPGTHVEHADFVSFSVDIALHEIFYVVAKCVLPNEAWLLLRRSGCE